MRRWRLLCSVAAVGLLLSGAPALALTPQQEQALQQAAQTGPNAVQSQVQAIVQAELAAFRPLDVVMSEIMATLQALGLPPDQMANLAFAAVQGAVQGATMAGIDSQQAAQTAAQAAIAAGSTDQTYLQALFSNAAASGDPTLAGGFASAAAGFGGNVAQTAQNAGLGAGAAASMPGAPGAGAGPAARALAFGFGLPSAGAAPTASPERPTSPASP